MLYEDVDKSNLWTAILNGIKDFPPLPPSLSASHASQKLETKWALPRNQHKLPCVQESWVLITTPGRIYESKTQRCSLFSIAFSANWSCLKCNKPHIPRKKSEQAGLGDQFEKQALEAEPLRWSMDICRHLTQGNGTQAVVVSHKDTLWNTISETWFTN